MRHIARYRIPNFILQDKLCKANKGGSTYSSPPCYCSLDITDLRYWILKYSKDLYAVQSANADQKIDRYFP